MSTRPNAHRHDIRHNTTYTQHSVALLVSNDVLEHELALLKQAPGGGPDALDENDRAIREAELNMKLNLLVRGRCGLGGGGSVGGVMCVYIFARPSNPHDYNTPKPHTQNTTPYEQVLRVQREEISIEQYMGMLTERIKRDQVRGAVGRCLDLWGGGYFGLM